MPEHQQIQQSKKPNTIFQKQAAPIKQIPLSNPMAIIQSAKINPKSLTHADVMQLQRTIGNRAVGKLLSEIGLIPSTAKLVQRQEIFEEGETCPSCVQRQEIPEEEEPLQGKMIETIQRQEIPEEEPLQSKIADIVQCQEMTEEEELAQIRRENNTGMPDNLKAGIESLSSIDMSDVRVHYNSDKPVGVGAVAYTQGTNIHVGPGQEQYLPHEAWHVVQQAQGRVKPSVQLKDGVSVNYDKGLEYEADVMGAKALEPAAKFLRGQEFLEKSQGSIVPVIHQRYEFGEVLKQPIIQMCDRRKMDEYDDEMDDSDEMDESDDEMDDSDEGDYVPPQGRRQKRYHFPKGTVEEVIKQTAHRRKHVNRKKFVEVFTCPACRRPLAYIRPGNRLELTPYSYTSSKHSHKHTVRAVALDHYPPWSGRERELKSREATDAEMRKDHNNPKLLRALCKKCNESHKYEEIKKVNYESDTDEEGYSTADDESENKGVYKPYRYDTDEDPGTGGAMTL